MHASPRSLGAPIGVGSQLSLERPLEHLARLGGLPAVDRVDRRVEHQRDTGEGLDRAVVQLQREAPPLVLLGGDPLLELPNALALLLAALALTPLEGRLSQ